MLLEGANLSEGRGTTLPFQLLGAPWIEGYALAEALNRFELPGLLSSVRSIVDGAVAWSDAVAVWGAASARFAEAAQPHTRSPPG